MSRSLLAAATAALVLGACLPRAETATLPGPAPAPLILAQEGEMTLPDRPPRPDTAVRAPTDPVSGTTGAQIAVLSVNPVPVSGGQYAFAELALACRDGAPVMALGADGIMLVSGGRWFAGGAEGRLSMTAEGGRVTAPATMLAGLSGRRVELQAGRAGGGLLAAQFELSDIREALALLPCG